MKMFLGKHWGKLAILLVVIMNLLLPLTTVWAGPPLPVEPRASILSFTITPKARPDQPPPSVYTTYFDIDFSVEVAGINIVDKIGQKNVPGEGHLVFSIRPPVTVPNRAAYTDEDLYWVTANTTATWVNATATYVDYAVQIVNNDDTPLFPPVYAEIRTNIQPPTVASDMAIYSIGVKSAPAATPPPATVTPATPKVYLDNKVTVQTSGFTAVANENGTRPNVSGEGTFVHYAMVDPIVLGPGWYPYAGNGKSYQTYVSSANPFTYTNETPGYFVYGIQLCNNNVTSLNPPVYAVIKTNLYPGISASPTPGVSPSPTSSQPGASPTSVLDRRSG